MDLTLEIVQTNIENGIFVHKPNENKRSKGQFWIAFDRIYEEIEGSSVLVNKFVYCRMCNKVFNYDSKKGISNLNTHSITCKEPVRSIRSFITRKNAIGFEDKKKLCLYTISASVKDTRPFSFTENDGVLELLHGVWTMGARLGAVTKEELQNALPSGTTVSRNINKLSVECKESIKKCLQAQLERRTIMAFTTDIWQDKFKRISYLCITAHYFDWTTKKLIDLLLALRPMEPGRKKDNAYVRELIMSNLDEYGISQYAAQFVFISDRGGNIRVALRDFVRLNCFPHFTHSTVKDACKIDSVATVINACASLVKYFKFNGLNNLLDITLKSAISTRFNYAVIMLESIHTQYEKIEEILIERNESIRLRNIDRECIGKLIHFLNTFMNASKLTESNYKSTLCNVWIGISEITSVCRIRDDDPTYIKAMKARALNYIETKFVLHKYHRVASFLNPNYKSLAFCTPSIRSKTIADIREMLNELTRETHSISSSQLHVSNISSSSSTLSNATNQRSSSGSEASFLSNYYDRTEQELDEIDSYISLKWVADSQLDLFDWWTVRRDVFPQLSEIAIQIHSIPASSLQSERHFSRCGITMNDRRNRMNPNTLENLMILNKHHNVKVRSTF